MSVIFNGDFFNLIETFTVKNKKNETVQKTKAKCVLCESADDGIIVITGNAT